MKDPFKLLLHEVSLKQIRTSLTTGHPQIWDKGPVKVTGPSLSIPGTAWSPSSPHRSMYQLLVRAVLTSETQDRALETTITTTIVSLVMVINMRNLVAIKMGAIAAEVWV